MSLDTTKADDIALVIEEAIVSGELEPGTVLRQEQLSEQFNVSRTPVREALRRLAALGPVFFVPNRGGRRGTTSPPQPAEACRPRAHHLPRRAARSVHGPRRARVARDRGRRDEGDSRGPRRARRRRA